MTIGVVKHPWVRVGRIWALVALCASRSLADVIITEPTGGNGVPADKSLNSTNGAGYTTLGDIVLTEGSTDDFAQGNGLTLILTIPDGWRFNPVGASVSTLNSRDITAASVAVTTSNVTVTFSVTGTTKFDQLTISGLQVQPLNGALDPNAGYILNLSANSGTATIRGVNQDLTTFGLLNTVPGAPRALSIFSQPSSVAMAGMPFASQPAIATLDQFGNQCFLDVTTVVSASRAAGSGTLQGTTSLQVISGQCNFTNLSLTVANPITILFTASNLTSVTSGPIAVGPATASQLLFTTQPGAAAAGAPFGIQPALKSQDQFGNDSAVGLPASQIVTMTLSSGTGSLSGGTNQDIGTNAGNGVVTYTNLQIDAAGNAKQLTASSSGFSSVQSSLFNVSGNGFSGLLVVVPGETFSPGTVAGKVGTPLSQLAGAAFSVTVYAVDANYNLVNNATDVVSIASSDSGATLPGNKPLVGGTNTFSVTLNTLGNATVTASDVTNPSKTSSTSSAIPVTSTPARLTLQTQPSATATAGAAFSRQPVVRVEDASGNLISSDNGRVITAARGTGTAALQGTLTATTVNGVATFSTLSYNVAETITIVFSATGLTNATSASVVVGPAAADRLIFSTQPGGVSRVGSPLATQPVIKTRDPYGNLSTVGLPASLPMSLGLGSGSGSLSGTSLFDIGSVAGNGLVTCTNLGCTTAGTNKQLTAVAAGLTSALSTNFFVGGFDPASGASAISADTAGGTYTTLTGPAYYEATNGDAGAGTIILNCPSGFSFDTGGTAPTVIITRIGGTGGNSNNVDKVASGTAVAITSRTTSQITLTVTNASNGGVTCSLTWTNVRVRPNAGTPLASGNITTSGTASLTGVTAGSTSVGALIEVAGLANRLAFTTQPGSATAGAVFGSQPVVRTRDQFGNNSTSGLAANRVVSLALTAGTGPLLGTTNLDVGTAAGNGLASFTNSEIDVAGTNKQLTASATGFTNAVSSVFTVSAAAASRLTMSTQPSLTATAGMAFAQQPVVRIEDPFGNLISSDNSTVVAASRGLGTGTLLGTVTRTAVNGLVTFTNLSYNVAETINLSFSSGSLTGTTSSNAVVSPAAANRLTIQTQPASSATAGVTFSPQPAIRIEDQYGNLRSSDNTTVVIATRSAGAGTLQGTTNLTAVGGIVTFTNLSHTVATNITIAFTSGTLSSATSSTITVSPAAASKLTILTQPSSTATAGVAFAQQPVVRVEDQYGNLRSTDSATVATASRNAGSGTLQGTTNLAAINGVVSFTNLYHALATNITINFAATGLTTTTSANVLVNAGAFTKLQLLAPGESAAPGSTSGKTGSPSAQTAGTAFSVTVNAVDANWNPITNVADTIAITSSDTNAVLPSNAALVSGTKTFIVTLKTAPSQTVTASDVTQPSKTANTSPAISLSPAAASRLTILTQPSSTATAGVIFAQQPVIRIEDTYGNLRSGDNSTVVTATRSAGSGTLQGTTNLTAVGGVVTFTNLSHTVATNITIQFTSGALTSATSGTIAVSFGAADHLLVVTQPSSSVTAGTVFAQQPVIWIVDQFGNRRTSDNSSVVTASRSTGTGSLQGNTTVTASGGIAAFANLSYNVAETITLAFNSGTLVGAISANIVVSPAAASRLTILTQPPGTATAGVVFAPQPAIRIEDQFGNLRNSDSSTVITATRAAGSGTLQGTTSLAAANGVVTFTNLSHTVATNITIQFTSGTLTSATSGAIAVSPAPASRLVFSAQPGSATAGALFGAQPAVKTQDQFGNDSTVGLGGSLPVTMSLSSGSGPLLGTTSLDAGTNAGNGLVAFSNLEIDSAGTNKQLTAGAPGLSNALSSVFSVAPATAARLSVQTQPSAAATAGAAFAQQPVVRIEDQFGNLISSDNSTVVSVSLGLGSSTLQGTLSRTAVNGVASFTNLSYNVAETINLTFASGSLTGTASSNVVVSAAAASRLTILTQPGATATAGVAFSPQPVVRIEDQFGNLRSSDNSTVVTASRGAGSGVLQGNTNITAVGGIVTFTNLSHTVATNITIQFASGTLAGATSSAIAVSVAPAARLTMQTQPSASATAGVAFTQQPVVRVEDSYGNLVAADNTTSVTAARASGAGTLQGTVTVTAVNGLVSYTNLSHQVATNITIAFSSGSLAGVNSASVSVSPAGASRLTISTQPPSGATAGAVFSPAPQVRIEDQFGNLRTSDNSTVVTAARSAGTGSLQGTTTATASGGVATFANLSYTVAETMSVGFSSGSLTAATSSNVVVSAAAANKLTILTQPSSTATAGVAFSQQPVIRVEDQYGNLRSGDNNSVVSAARSAGIGVLQGSSNIAAINGIVTFTNLSHNVATNITIAFTSGSLSAATSSVIALSPAAAAMLTIKTQPSASATAGVAYTQQPVLRIEDAFGNLITNDNTTVVTAARNLGTGPLQGALAVAASGGLVTFTSLSYNVAETMNLSFTGGSLTPAVSSNVVVSPAAASRLTILTQPPSTATAGVLFAPQPAIRIEDQFGNLRSSDSSTVVTATRAAGSGTLQGTTSLAAANGVVTFTNLSHTVATNITIQFSSGTLTSATSGTVAISPASASRLVFTAQPGSATAGAPFGAQPGVKTQDQFGNDSTVGLGGSLAVTMSLSSGSGPLLGTTNLDAGTNAGNGQVAFNNLEIDSAGTNKQLTASAPGLSNALSSVFSVAPATAARLTVQTQPSAAATAGAAFAQQPVVRIEDQFGNLISSDNSTVVSVSLGLGSSTLQGTLSRTAVNGLVSFTNLSYNVAETINLTFASGSLTGTASSNVVVSAAAASRLTILTQPGPTAVAGVAFSPQPVVRIEDQFGNLRSSDNSTVVSASRGAGSGTLQGTTNQTAVGGVVSFTNLSHTVATNITIQFASGTLAGATSSSIAISVAPATRLTMQTQPSASATAGVAFAQQPVVRVEDSYGNLVAADNTTSVTAARASGAGTLHGTVTLSAVNGLVSYTNLSHLVATNITIAFSSGSLAGVTSASVSVSPAVANRLTITTQPPAAVTAGAVFSPVPQVRIEDQYGNLRSSDNSTVVSAGRNLGSGSLQGTTTATASGGVATFANLSYTVAETMNVGFSSGSLTGATSSNVVVGVAAANKLTILTQPSSTATAGVVFAQQPMIRVEDQYGNLRSGDNSTVVTAARASGTGTLQGTLTATASGGVASFGNLSYTVAESMKILFSSGSLTNATSSNVVVGAGAFAKLQLLAPGETAAPGSVNGKTGTPTAQSAYTAVNLTVNAVDANWNRVSTVTDTVGITSSDATAVLPMNAALIAGTQAFTFFFGTSGTFTVTAADLSDGSKTASTSPAITVNAIQFTPATGGSAISADTAGGTFTALTGPTYSEIASGNVGTGTIILKPSNGFIFDTGGTAPTVRIDRLSGSGSPANNINGVSGGTSVAMTSVTTTQLVFTLTSSSISGVTCKLTWQSVRVRPTAGIPLANSYLAPSGTASVVGVSTNSNLGVLREVAGAANRLAIQTQPSSSATAGVPFAQQPVIQVQDQFGNLRSANNLGGAGDNSTVVTAARNAGSGALQGATTLTATDGLVTYTNLTHIVATNITITFSSGSLSNATSSSISVGPAAADHLVFTTQPGNATAGGPFGTQPALKSQDAFGNYSAMGLPLSRNVTVALTSGTGILQGTTTLDIGTAAGNGSVACTDLRIDTAGTNKQLTASASGLSSAVSAFFTVNPTTPASMNFAQQPTSATAGANISPAVTVRVLDGFGNPLASVAVSIGLYSGTGTLSGTLSRATDASGIATFNDLSLNLAGSKTLAATSGALSTGGSTAFNISPAAAARLTILTQPSPSATAGAAFAQQPVIRIEDQFGNLETSDVTTTVSATRSAGGGTLQGTTGLTAVNGLVTFTNLSHNVATNITIAFSSGSLTGATSTNIAVSPATASKLTIATQPSLTATAGVAFAQQPVVRIEDAFGNLCSGDNSTAVSAARAAGGGTLQGSTNVAAVNGVVSFTNLAHLVATNITIAFSSGSLAGATSSGITVSPAAAASLSFVQAPSDATAGVAISPAATVCAKDSFGNNVPGVSVSMSLSSGSGALSGTTPRPTDASGLATFNDLSINLTGAKKLTASAGALSTGESGAFTISAAAATRLTVQTQPSATATAGVAFGQQPVVRVEDGFGNLVTSDNSTVVIATRAAGSGMLQGTAAMTAIGGVVSFTNLSHNVATSITIAFSSGSLAGATSTSIAVSPAAASRLTIQTQPASTATAGVAFTPQPVLRIEDTFGNLVNTDNSTVVTASRLLGNSSLQGTTSATASSGVVTFSNLSYNLAETISLGFASGSLSGTSSSNVVVSPGAASRLTLQTPPSSAATAGVVFSQQPVVRVEDQFGNLRTSDNATVVIAARNAGSGPLQGTTNLAAVNGLVAFTNLCHNVATNITISFSSGSLAVATSGTILVSPAAANRLVFGTQPASATAGAPFGVQPAIKTQDALGNDSTVALPGTLSVTISLSSGTGPLQGSTSLDIGANAGNGLVSFSDLEIDIAGTNKQLSVVATGLSNALSSVFTVSPAAANHLTIQTQPPSAATAGVAFSPQPQIRIEDAFGNQRTGDNATLVTATAHAGASGSLQGTVTATVVNGVASFSNLSYNIGETISIDLSGGGLPVTNSQSIAVNPAPASRLTIQTQPSTTAVAGVVFAQQAVIRIEDAYGNLRNSDNGSVVTASRSAGSGILQGTTNLTAAGGIVSFTNLSHTVATNITLSFASAGLSGATSASIAVSPAAANKLTIQRQPSATATAGAAFAQQPIIRIEDQFGNLRSSDNGTLVTASRNAGTGILQGATNLSAINGVVSFTNLAHNVATTITIDFNSTGLNGNTSANVVVSPAAFARLQLLAPGESAAPGTPSGKSGSVLTQTAGSGYSVTVNAVDTNWNVVTSVADTVSITCTDPNDVLPANAALASGTKTFSLTNRTAGIWTITATDISDGTKSASTSPAITVGPGLFAKLQLLVPGETNSPGSAAGKMGTPAAQTAGTAFSISANAVDANWNVVTSVTDNVAITSTDTNAITGSGLQLVNGSLTASVTLKTAGSRTLTATDLSDGSKAANTSPSIAVNAGALVKLQLLAPGESPAPGTASGKTGAALAQIAGTAFGVTVNAVDANWNVVTNVTHTVGITSSDLNATMPANAALVLGTKAFSVTLKTAGMQSLTASDITSPSIQPSTNPAIQVVAGAASKLTILTQPPGTATAGVAFVPQPVVRVEDAFGNLVSTDNGRVVTATRGTGTGALQGATTTATVNGVATFANLSYNVAETITINFSTTGLTNAASGNIVVSPASATQLALTTQPGGLSRTASPLATQPVLRSQDSFGNNSTIGLPASLNVSLSLTAGSGSLLGTTVLDIGTGAGNGTVTFTNVECSDAGTNKQITASAAGLSNAISATFLVGGVDRATGGTAIPSSSAGGAYTTLTGPMYYEAASGDVGTGTYILNAPSGFVFDTGGTAPTMLVTRIGGTGASSLNIDGVASGTSEAISSISTTQIKFSEKTASGGGVTCALTWQNVRVRPTASSPLANGTITKTGSSTIAAVTASVTSLGSLIEVGPAARLTIQTQPSPTAMAGVAFQTQPVIRIEDAFGNLITSDNSTVVTAARSAGAGTLQGTLTAAAAGGLVKFTNQFHTVATNITLSFTSGSLSGTNSSTIAVRPASATQLVFVTQPANGMVGAMLASQPSVCAVDQFGNASTVGLGGSKSVNVVLSSGTGPLLGTPALDIGTNAGNGLVSFTNLRVDSAGTNKQMTASATGLSNAVSGTFIVVKSDQTITFGALPNRSYGTAPFALNATASSGLPVSFSVVGGPASLSGNTLTITGTGTVTVRASQAGDSNWNAAAPVDQSFVVSRGDQTITFSTMPDKAYGAAPFALNATTSSGLPVSFSVIGGPATLSGSTLSITGTGTVTVRASQGGDSNWNAAAAVDRAFTVVKSDQTITFGALPNTVYGVSPFALNATASSGLPVGFSVIGGPATLSGNTLSITGTGTVTVRASQGGDSNWNAAAAVDRTFTVVKSDQTITFGALPDKVYGDAPFALNATASSGLPVSFSVVGGPATLSGNTLTITGTGTVTVRASQAGDSNWNSAAPVDQSFNVSRGDQTITFGTLPDKTYGAAPFALNATASSGLPVTFSVVGGPATLSGNMLSIISPGTVTVRAWQGGDSNWYPATPVDQTFNVAKAILTVTADNKSRLYGTTNPPCTVSYSGFVNGEDSSELSGAPSLSTTATITSSVAGGPYPITVTQGTLSAANYSFVFVNGQLTITPGSVSGTLTSSANPSPSGSNLTFTATLIAVAPASGIPNGTVQFCADGTAFGPAIVFSNGIACFTTASLSHGVHQIKAVYSSDGNFVSATNSLGADQIINTVPVAQLATYQRSFGSAVQIPIANLLTNFTSDADGDLLAVLWVGTGTNNATISISGDSILYQPSDTDPNRNTADCFSYAITDGFSGGTATNKIQVTLSGPDPSSQPPILTRVAMSANQVLLSFTAIAGYTYHVERASSVVNGGSDWTDFGSATTDGTGSGQFIDPSPMPGHGFYRVVWKP